jgi:hypothetical protein
VAHDLGTALTLVFDLDLGDLCCTHRLVKIRVSAYLDMKPHQRRESPAADRLPGDAFAIGILKSRRLLYRLYLVSADHDPLLVPALFARDYTL